MPRPPRTRALVVALAVFAVIAGCVAPAGGTEPNASDDDAGALANWWERAIPSSVTTFANGDSSERNESDAHDHANRAHHANLTTPNFEVLGWDPLTTDTYGQTLTGMGCGGTATRDDGRRLAIVHSIATDVSFVVADVTDPAAPQMLGEFYMPNAVVWDADITADGMHVLIGAYPPAIVGDNGVTLPPVPPMRIEDHPLRIVWRDACTGAQQEVTPLNYAYFGPGIVMVGIQDPTNPTFEDWVSQPVVGPHSVSSALIDGVVWATASVTNLNHEGSYYTFFHVETLPSGQGKLVPVSVIRAPGVTSSPQNQFTDNGHVDVTLEKHPVTQQVLAYLANWNAGMSVYDMTNPAAPQHVATWMDGDAGNVHTTYPFPQMIGDKHYLAVGQEVGEPVDLPSGWIYILDVTDPAAPVEVGRWTLPVKPKWDDGGLMFSPHYVAVLNHTMFVSNYHGGLWALDITNLSEPLAYGLFVPDREPPTPYGDAAHGPTIEDVIVDQTTGILTTWDNAGGVYTLRFHEDVPVPRAPAWPFTKVSG